MRHFIVLTFILKPTIKIIIVDIEHGSLCIVCVYNFKTLN